MNLFFCSLQDTQSFHSRYKVALKRYIIISISIALVACNIPSKKEQGPAKKQLELPNPGSVSKLEGERLRNACEAWYLSVLKSKGFNGGIVVAKKGNIIFEAYNGSSRLNGLEPMNDSASLHIASVSKTFTAMATLKLWQDGKLNIDDEFSKYFPSFNYPGVTIRSLLNHRSGLPNYVHFMENMGWDKRKNITNEEVLHFLITRKNNIQNIGKPNKGFAYCNTNFALLALLIEKVSGEKYGNFLQETFFAPLQMKHTFVYNNSRDSGKVSMSYDYRGKLIPLNFLDCVYGDKNIYSTPRDLLIWDRALTGGSLFTQKTLEEAYTPYSNEKPGIRNYGLGWRMNNFPSGKKMIYHNGWWHGNNAAFIRLLEDSATIVVLGNKYNRGIYHAKDLANLFGNYFGTGEEEEMEAFKSTTPETAISPAKTSHKKILPRKKGNKKNWKKARTVKKTSKKTRKSRK
jgi:CubicO group peptidase (beta-lactamase class C family)